MWYVLKLENLEYLLPLGLNTKISNSERNENSQKPIQSYSEILNRVILVKNLKSSKELPPQIKMV